MMTQRIQFDDRAAHLSDLKRQIAAGTYDTDWRLSLALNFMLDAMLDEFEFGQLDGDEPDARPHQPR
jgi:hypothetical protein